MRDVRGLELPTEYGVLISIKLDEYGDIAMLRRVLRSVGCLLNGSLDLIADMHY